MTGCVTISRIESRDEGSRELEIRTLEGRVGPGQFCCERTLFLIKPI